MRKYSRWLRMVSTGQRAKRARMRSRTKFVGFDRELLSVCAPAVSDKGASRMALTRRALLEHIGAIGGAGAAYLAMEALGLAVPTPAGAENFTLPPTSGKRPFRGYPRRRASPVLSPPTSCSAPAIASLSSRRATGSAAAPGPFAAATRSSRSAGPISMRRFRSRTLFQRRARAHPFNASRDPGLRAALWRAARDFRQRQSQCRLGLRREGPPRAALGQRYARPPRRAARQGDRPACVGPGGAQGTSSSMFASSLPRTPSLTARGTIRLGGSSGYSVDGRRL